MVIIFNCLAKILKKNLKKSQGMLLIMNYEVQNIADKKPSEIEEICNTNFLIIWQGNQV